MGEVAKNNEVAEEEEVSVPVDIPHYIFWIYQNVYLNTQYLTISEKGLFCLAKTYHNIHIYVLTLIIRKTILERGLLSLTRKHSGIFLRNLKEELQQR